MVPNEFPIRQADYRIAIIGEAPGADEEDFGRPFVGQSGKFLTSLLIGAGIDRYSCLVGNVCQHRPPNNEISLFNWNGHEIQTGLTQLQADIDAYNPNICVLLGNTPLHAAAGLKAKISDWRGSLFMGQGPFEGRKCIASLHPAFILREFSGYPLLKFDLKRAKEESFSPDLILPHRTLITDINAELACQIMDTWPKGQRCSVDIEGTLGNWICVGVAAKPTMAFTIVWNRYSDEDRCRTLYSFARLMHRDDVPKVLQNQLYDNFVLSYGYGILIRHVAEDTMIKGWSIYAELPRSLSTQASVWTRQPHWKDDSMYAAVGEGLYRGCAMDSAVTLEICTAQDNVLNGRPLTHYRKIIELQKPFLYMELRGILYDKENARRMLSETGEQTTATKLRLIKAAGKPFWGKLGSLSYKKLTEVLYVDKGYPPQYAKDTAGRKTKQLTSDVEAILTLKKQFPDDTFLSDILLHRHLEGVRETLSITADPDGRVRCGYSLEAETGRVKCYKSPTGSGANMQTIQKGLRSNYVADPGYELFQVDLEGADGWTVACECSRLGDSTMLDDYLAGMKPAKIIALLYWFGPEINGLERSDLKWLHDNMFPIVISLTGKWLYMGCKRVQHGSSYLMGIPTMCLNILKDSFKESGTPIYMEQSVARSLQNAFFSRYPGVQTWHNWAQSKLVADGQLDATSGQNRVFFGRRFGDGIHETVKEFLAHRPQSNTTYATNLAVLNLWNDLLNRRPDGSLIIEPLHQIHDAILGQYPIELREWAHERIRSYFSNKLTIAEREITIPFELACGPNWGELKVL